MSLVAITSLYKTIKVRWLLLFCSFDGAQGMDESL